MTALRRWDPWRELSRVQDDLSSMFERAFGSERRERLMLSHWMPDVDIYEKENKIYIRMDIPEIEPEDIDISIVDNTMKIKGERKMTEEVKEENYYRMERRYGSFERMIELPVSVKMDAIEATYKNGVLHVELPKAEEVKAKEIKIKAA
ncbi:MAG: Hsp20/alpha crystallin family protein [Actinomycetota bacterium]|nr:Hsp20/alpha crystallin family protein [Actinomycetota bacterium]